MYSMFFFQHRLPLHLGFDRSNSGFGELETHNREACNLDRNTKTMDSQLKYQIIKMVPTYYLQSHITIICYIIVNKLIKLSYNETTTQH